MNTIFILYVMSGTIFLNKTHEVVDWKPKGEFQSVVTCQKAAHALGYRNHEFKCLKK